MKEDDYITIAGKDIECIIKKMNIFELEYYPENPRINRFISECPTPATQEIIEEKLWDEDSVKDLYQDIKKNQGLIEEIIVKGKQVIEGNSRLCAYRHLYKKATTDEEKKLWNEIRAKILPETISDEELFVLLGTLHIKLKTQWKPFEKAGYVYRMVEKLNRNVDELAGMLNTSEADVQSDIDSYSTMQSNGVKDIAKYSYFKEFYKDSRLKEKERKDSTFLAKFVQWVVDDRIPRAEDVRDLYDILEDKKVGPKFIQGIYDFEESYDILKKRHPDLEPRGRQGNIYKHMKQMREKLQKAPVQKIKEEIEYNKNKKAIVEYFVKEVGKFADNLEIIKKYKGK